MVSFFFQAVFTGLLVLYIVLFVWFSYRALHLLRRLPYNRHRMANVVMRLQLRESLVVMVVGITTMVVLAFLGYGNCNGVTLLLLGVVTVQFLNVMLVTCKAYCTSICMNALTACVN